MADGTRTHTPGRPRGLEGIRINVLHTLHPPATPRFIPDLSQETGSLDRSSQVTSTHEHGYQYGFSMTAQRIISEHLLVYKAFKPQRWFTRRYDTETGKDVYDFGPGLKGPKNLWEGTTRANALFLSMAMQLNSEALRPVFDWFVNRLVISNEQPLEYAPGDCPPVAGLHRLPSLHRGQPLTFPFLGNTMQA